MDDYGNSILTAGSLTIGTSLAGEIETANDRDWFAVNLVAGAEYSFEISSDFYGADIFLYDSNSNLVTSAPLDWGTSMQFYAQHPEHII